MSKLAFLVYSKNTETRAHVVEQLIATDRAVVAATLTDLDALADALHSRPIDGVYLDLDEDPDRTLDSLEGLVAEPRPLILLGAVHGDSQILLRAMRLGARDFFLSHRLTGVEALLQHTTPQRASLGTTAPTVAVVGAKGGVGATMVACELGVALQETGLRTIVVDLSRRLGDVSLYFDLRPRYDLTDIVRQEGELDSVFVDAVVESHESQVSVLAAPSKLEDVTFLSSAKLERVLKFLQTEFDCIILDLPWDFDEFSLRALDMANEIIFVTTPDVVALTHTRTRRQMVERFGALPERVHVALNRTRSRATIDEKQIVDFLECEIDASIPDQPAVGQACTDKGLILREVEESEPMRRAIRVLRNRVCEWCHFDMPLEDESAGAGKLLGRLRSLVRRR